MLKPSQLLNETTIPLARVPQILPASARANGRIHRSTAFRWAFKGRRSQSGVLVKLETVRLGHSIYSSQEAVFRFVDALNDKADGDMPQVRSPRQRERDSEMAGRELEKHGA